MGHLEEALWLDAEVLAVKTDRMACARVRVHPQQCSASRARVDYPLEREGALINNITNKRERKQSRRGLSIF